MKLKNSNCDETKNLKFWWNPKTQIVMELKNSNCDESQKVKLWWNSKKSICDETWKLQLWCNSKTHIVIKLKNSNFDKTPKLKYIFQSQFSQIGFNPRLAYPSPTGEELAPTLVRCHQKATNFPCPAGLS